MTGRSPSERFFDAIAAELNEERAAVLGRYGRRVEDSIAEAESLLARIDASDDHSVRAYRASRRRVLSAVADLCVQREMIGLMDHSWVERIYPVPPPR